MYNRREKLQLFNQLRGEEHAKADLSLLDDENPRHPKLTRFARDPQRYADEILYALLDICDADEIEDNRKFIKGMEDASSETLTDGVENGPEGSANTLTGEAGKCPEDSSKDLTGEEEKYPEGSSKTSADEAEKGSDGSSETLSAEEAPDTPEGKAPPEETAEAAGQEEDGKKVVQKEEEYPNIDWDNLYNEDVQMATVIYNDRINTWRKMKKLDEVLDKKPKERDVAAMAELRIRNLQAFEELKAYNDTGKFLYKHPLLRGKSEFDELVNLFRNDPAEFLHKHKNVLDNIKRYKSYIKRDDRKEKRASDRENLQRHQERERMFKMVMEQYSDKSDKSDGKDG